MCAVGRTDGASIDVAVYADNGCGCDERLPLPPPANCFVGPPPGVLGSPQALTQTLLDQVMFLLHTQKQGREETAR